MPIVVRIDVELAKRKLSVGDFAERVGITESVAAARLRELTDLTDEEFAAVASDLPPILPRYDLYVDRADWVNQKWSEMITG